MRALLPLLCLTLLARAAAASGAQGMIPPLPPPSETPGPTQPGPPGAPLFPPAPASIAPPTAAPLPAERTRGPDSVLVLPEVTTQVVLSNRDVNWLRCGGEISEVVTS